MSKLEKLYELAEDVLNSTDELYRLSYNNVEIDSKEYKESVDNVKRKVFEEYEFVSAMNMKEVDSCLNDFKKLIEENYELTETDDLTTFEGITIFLRLLIDKEETTLEPTSKYNADILLRVFDRLKNQSYILCGEGIAIGVKRDKEQRFGYKVSVYDALISSLNLEVIKRMKQKIYNLVPTRDDDYKFTKDLKYNQKCLEFISLLGNFVSEMLFLSAYTDIDKIKLPSIDKLKDKMGIDEFIDMIYEEAKNIVDDLSEMTTLKYTPGAVFDFLKLVTSFEVYMQYLDLVHLNKIAEYCDLSTNKENTPCMSGITGFAKARIKKKEKE